MKPGRTSHMGFLWTAAFISAFVARIPAWPSQTSSATQTKWQLEVGDVLPPLVGKDLSNKEVRVDYRGALPTVIYVIAPYSAWNVKNEAAFASLVSQARTRYRFVLLIPDEEPRSGEYMAKVLPALRAANPTVIAQISPVLKAQMFLGSYPQTLVVSTDGKLVRNFNGAYNDDSRSAKPADIEKFFGVKLARQ